MTLTVTTLETSGLGDRSYVIDDGNVAVVVDPQRDIERVTKVLSDRGVRPSHVVETHVHNDYVTGGLQLARATGAAYGVAAAEPVDFERLPLTDGDELLAGWMRIRVLATPGHTPHHQSFAITSGAEAAVFTGGSLLYGTVGRTDLISPEATDGLTRSQYRSVQRLLTDLADGTAVYPTHGFGSFCASTPGSEETTASTIGMERQINVVAGFDREDDFVAALIAGLTAYPRYYAHMAPANRAGPVPVDPAPLADLDEDELRRRIEAGEWVVDLRTRQAFAAGHLPGAIGVEYADSFATYLGWTIPWETPVTLIGDSAAEVADARIQLSRIGIDQPEGRSVAVPAGSERYRIAGFADLVAERERATVLDVRDPHEWDEGHIDGASHVPFYDLEACAADLPDGELWIHCRTGYRASIACSLLQRTGREVVLVDDDWEKIGEHDLAVVR